MLFIYIPYICSSSRKFWWVDCSDAIAISGSSRVFYLRLYLCIMMLRVVHWLSSKIVIGSTEYSFRSTRNRCNHIDSWAAFANVICSASAVDKATQVLFLFIPADCSTTYNNESRCWFLAGHHDLQPNLHLRIQQCCHLQDSNPKSGVPIKYLMFLFTAIQCVCVGFDEKRATFPTAFAISSLVFVDR